MGHSIEVTWDTVLRETCDTEMREIKYTALWETWDRVLRKTWTEY